MYRMAQDDKSKPIPVRFTGPTTGRIHRAAKRSGLTQAAIIRLGVLTILPQIEAGTIKLPNQAA